MPEGGKQMAFMLKVRWNIRQGERAAFEARVENEELELRRLT